MNMDNLPEKLHNLMLEDHPPVDSVTDCFRTLRNSCAESPNHQTMLGTNDSVISDSNTAIGLGLNADKCQEWALCLRISAQFLGNLTVNNTKNQKIVWDQCSSQLKRMALHGDPKLTNICLMVLYNILLGSPNITSDFVEDEEFVKIVCNGGSDGQEFAQYIVEHLLSQDIDWRKMYTSAIPVNARLFVLEVVENSVKQSADRVPVGLVSQLASHFCQQSDCILRTVADKVDQLEPVEVATLLSILASCSSHDKYLPTLQQDRNFFINCAFLLKSIHMAGKEGANCFSAVPKLAAAEDEMQYHPAFGFKAHLVRVLGNLCWKHKSNQDLMKELEVIPLLLDCCNIDARNPFIIQWVVLAMRNLCEGNIENQRVIASMNRQGFIDSAVLNELGLTLHGDEENQLRIVPLHPS